MTRTPLIDIHWRTSLLSAISRCDTLQALEFLRRRWSADVAGCEWREEIVKAKDARKEALRGQKTVRTL